MKKQNLRKLALLGLASGFIISSQTSADAAEDDLNKSALSLVHQNPLAAAHECGGPHGCPGLMADRDRSTSDSDDPNSGNMNYHILSEEELLLELNEKGRALYRSMDPAGKKLARLVASQLCNGTNECKGLNGCQTDQNECAGKGKCRSTSKCSIADKNLAIKLVADKLAKKRNNALQNSSLQD